VTLVSEPHVPESDDDFDRRTTNQRNIAPSLLASSDAVPLLVPKSAAVPLLRPQPPEAPQVPQERYLPSSLPPMAMNIPGTSGDEDLIREVLRLRRWVKMTGALSVASLACCAVLAALLLRAHEAPQSQSRTLAPVTPAQVEPPVSESPAAAPPAPSAAPSASAVPIAPPNDPLPTIEVRVVAPSPRTVVMLARRGEPAKQIPGPFPQTVKLPPGVYAVFAARGSSTWSHPLYLTPERGNQELVITFSH
jgi:hypothetical protein